MDISEFGEIVQNGLVHICVCLNILKVLERLKQADFSQ